MSFPRRARAAGLFVVPLAVAAAVSLQLSASVTTGADTGTTGRARAAAPNIVLIVTDDQDRGDLRWMPKTRHLLGDHGVTFTRAISPDPLCCPARAEILTGQLGQNNGVSSNSGPHGGFQGLLDRRNTLAPWLQAAGYQTALVGKYLNGYRAASGRPPGWTIWTPTVRGLYSYDHTTFLDDGDPVTRTANVTPVISAYSVDDVHRLAAGGSPFFLWVSHVAPHGQEVDGAWRPPLPAAHHRHDLLRVRAPMLRKPSFNRLGPPPWPYPDLAGVHQSPQRMQYQFTRRLQSLLDVDDAVEATVTALRDVHQLENTYVFLVSDNANLLGEHGVNGKGVLYREALEIPLVVRVPGSTGAHVSSLPVTLPDLTSTILALTGAVPGRLQDGQSFAPVLSGGTVPFKDTELIQTGTGLGDWSFRGVWTGRYTYLHRVSDGRSFLYDHRSDPYELHDVAPSPRYHQVRAELDRRLRLLETCAGESCDQHFGPPPLPG
jgi:arylsulfatase A-like enzyme